MANFPERIWEVDWARGKTVLFERKWRGRNPRRFEFQFSIPRECSVCMRLGGAKKIAKHIVPDVCAEDFEIMHGYPTKTSLYCRPCWNKVRPLNHKMRDYFEIKYLIKTTIPKELTDVRKNQNNRPVA